MTDSIDNQTHSLRRTAFLEWTEKLSFLFFCLCILDCSFTGSGRYVEIFSLSPRIIAGFLSLILILPKLIFNFRAVIRNPILISFLIFLVYTAICAVRGYLAENLMTVWISDIKGFMWLYLVPVAVLTVTSESRLNTILGCITAGTVIQILLIFVMNVICSRDPIIVRTLYIPFWEIGVGSLSTITYDITRIFLKSSPYMVFACCICIFKQLKSKRINWFYMAVVILSLAACLLSFTRSLYGCIFVAAAMCVLTLLIFYRKQWRRWVACILLIVIGFGIATYAMEKIFDASYMNFALFRTFGIPYEDGPGAKPEETEPVETEPPVVTPPVTTPSVTTPPVTTPPAEAPTAPIETPISESDPQWDFYNSSQTESEELRELALSELTALIRQNPIFGNGLGASAPSREGPDEYFYHDILARMGIVGLILYLSPFALVLIACLKKKNTLVKLPMAFAIICGMCGFWAITFFNPWMNAALGIAMYALCSTLPGVLDSMEENLPSVKE